MPDPDMKRIFQEAAEIAKGLPRGLQEAAFNRALDVLLGGGTDTTEEEADDTRRIFALPGSRTLLDTSVAAINLVADRLGIEELDADEVAEFLEEKVGPHLNEGMVGRALDGADSMFRTIASVNPLQTFSHPLEEDQAQDTRDTPKKKAGAKRKKPAAKGAKSPGKTKGKSETKRASVNGPTQVIVDLVKRGFFASARTASQVALYLNRQGFNFTVYQLTPVLLHLIRAGLLQRRTDAHGQYVYEKA
ncbi:MAG TPA: hypothetical protein PKI11_12410 [Candidatus Hydrogenedentes bacterium]|nr:hypothetical protein [Candidatus Hydrogenedentota bacterium]HNT87027.1 hypothetical protein [Candidatus Hydrogenedentota bacterium]